MFMSYGLVDKWEENEGKLKSGLWGFMFVRVSNTRSECYSGVKYNLVTILGWIFIFSIKMGRTRGQVEE